MAKKTAKEDEMIELLKNLLITSLGLGGVPQQEVRKIVGCDMRRVSRILRHLKGRPGRPER